MDLEQQCLHFINSPFPLWEMGLTNALVMDKWKKLNVTPAGYNTSHIWHNEYLVTGDPGEIIFSAWNDQVFLESADFNNLSSFYLENRLDLMTSEEVISSDAKDKLKKAIALLTFI